MDHRYLNVLKRLYQVNRFKNPKISLENVEKMASLIGNPHKGMDFIHIAGTNGKGSVALKTAKVLEAANYKVGLYTSPHVSTFRERIQINGQLIEKEFIIDQLEYLFNLAEKKNIEVSYFEYVTLLAFQYYKEKRVDVVSLETGLGGTLDATNIVDPLVSVITSIGLDHLETLGYTIPEIAEHKAGIMKPNRPTVVGPCVPHEVFIRRAKQVGCQLYSVDADRSTVKDFDQENQKITRQTIVTMQKYYAKFVINEAAFETGLKAEQICRLEHVPLNQYASKVSGKPPQHIILDVGHNPPALDRALMTLNIKYPKSKIRVIYGTSHKKDAYESLKNISQFAHKIHLVNAQHVRAMPIGLLEEAANKLRAELTEKSGQNLVEPVFDNGNISKTIKFALDCVARGGNTDYEIIFIAGSFYIMQEARAFLSYKDEIDPFELNELIAPEDRGIGSAKQNVHS